MKTSEVKMRLLNKANSLIDTYFNQNNLTEKFINSTLKIIMKQNIHKIDDIFELFADKDGEIDLNMVVHEYTNMIPENGIIFDIKEFVNNELVKGMLPDKVLLIKREDISSILT
jgi:hypothetical protein